MSTRQNSFQSGSSMKNLGSSDKLDELRDYVLSDVKITHQLYERVREIGLVK